MAKQGRIYYTDRDFSDAEAGSEFGYPVILILTKDSKIVKITAYDELGNKSIALLDSENSNKIVSLGAVTYDSSKIYLAVDSSGSNSVVINQNLYSKTTPDQFPYTVPTSGKVKVALIYALETTQIFYMIQGAEGETAIEPTLPAGALLVRRIIITDGGPSIDPSVLDGFVEKQEESWKVINIGNASSFSIDYSDARSRFKINSASGIAKTLNSIVFSQETFRAVEFWIYNATDGIISIPISSSSGLTKGFTKPAPFSVPFTILPQSKALLKYNPTNNNIECWRDNASSDVFPTTGNNGDILEKDSTVTGGVKWVDRLGGLTANFAPIWNGLKMISSVISQNAGKIGIGTTSPAEMLDVNGRVKATSVILPANGNTAVANRLRSDGTKLYYANDSAVERGISFDGILRYGSQNPPTIAELTALGIQRGEFYVQTSNGTSSGTEVQRAMFNGAQLVDWSVTSAVYATLSQAQKDAVKYITIAG